MPYNKFFAVLIALILVTQAAMAEETGFQYHVEVVKASASPGKRIMDSSTWRRFAKKTTIIESADGIGEFGKPELLFAGLKYPIHYNSPRAGAPQVQYIDIGLKLDITVVKDGDGVKVEVRPERSAKDPHPKQKSRTGIFVTETRIPMKLGQTAVTSIVSGKFAQEMYKAQFPGMSFGPNDKLMFAITLK